MAEHVQAALDQMVEPLQDLQERHIFSPSEIRTIVERRKDSEYLLRRRHARKEDFVKYIQDEVLLEQLRRIRTRKVQRDEARKRRGKHDASEISKHSGDRHILQHIHLLYTRAFRKFRADQDLYLQYAEFLKHYQLHSKLSQLYSNVLAIFPREVSWWIRAASHELFTLNHVSAARILLQRGLRINPAATELWIQYFLLELHVVQKMRARQQVLLSLDQKDEKKTDAAACTVDDNQYELAQLVHDNAIQAVPVDHSESMRLAMWYQCEAFPHIATLQQHILTKLRSDCGETTTSSNPQTWIAVAQCTLRSASEPQITDDEDDKNEKDLEDDDENESSEPQRPMKRQKIDTRKDPVVRVLTEATKRIPTAEMYVEAIRFLRSIPDNTPEHNRFVERLFQIANTRQKLLSVDLLLEQVDYLETNQQNKAALKKLQKFTEVRAVKDPRVWVRWAHLRQTPQSFTESIQILRQGLKEIPMSSSNDHMTVLLQLLGLLLAVDNNHKKSNHEEISELWTRMLLLAPGCARIMSESPFGVEGIADACRQYLAHCVSVGRPAATVRKVYQSVLFESSLLKNISETDAAFFKDFIDTAIKFEMDEGENERKKRVLRILEVAVKCFSNIPSYKEIFEQQQEDSYYGSKPSDMNRPIGPVSFDFDRITTHEINEVYQKYQVVHLRGVKLNSASSLRWRSIGALFEQLSNQDQESWCIEQKPHSDSTEVISPEDFLQPMVTAHRAYCSFLVQKDTDQYQEALQRLPLKDLSDNSWFYEKALWIFFGRNPVGESILPGRTDHTDSVSHSGTWHYQLSGFKEWIIHPTKELVEQWTTKQEEGTMDLDTTLRIVCRERDVLIVNTRLWFHQTEIPAQTFPSVSYARDFRVQGPSNHDGGMTNVDGLYATENIKAGKILFTEKDMPDCELHRSAENPNCEIIELEDGTGAIASLRDIASGEFFCVAESDDDDDDDEAEDDDDEEEDNDGEDNMKDR